MYARVPQVMAQFVLKIEKLSHIVGIAPILEMKRAYGLRPRLWLLSKPKNNFSGIDISQPTPSMSLSVPSFSLAYILAAKACMKEHIHILQIQGRSQNFSKEFFNVSK